MPPLRTAIYLFRNDLRLHDNECLEIVNKTADFLINVYCFDPAHFRQTWHFGFQKTAPFRAKFLIQSVENLKNNLKAKNSDLLIALDSPENTLKSLVDICASTAPVTSLVYQKEITFEEVNVENSLKNICRSNDIKVQEVWGSTLYHVQDVPFKSRQVPDTYTQFRKEVEGRSRVRGTFPTPESIKPFPQVKLPDQPVPSLADLGLKEPSEDPRSAFPFAGGETTALERLNHYLWDSRAVETYKETRNGLLGKNYSTKFSPWLALGCISPRRIFKEIKKYEREEVANKSTYWVIFELIWRDYFKFVCLKFGDKVFYRSGILGSDQEWSQDMKQFKAWAEGRTGVPFVDANMRELKETGWMSNRGRQNVASFLIKDLGLDWRLGAEWFESYLLDHDVCSNYGNWNYAAGIGNDPRENRKFNMVKQGMDYDADGQYIRTWVQELKKIGGGKVHVPWTLSSRELEAADVDIGITYPKPMVIAPEWGRHTQKSNKRPGYRDPPKGQKGIDFYFKSGPKSGEATQGGGGSSGGGYRAGGGHKKGGKGAPRGGRVQY